MDFAHSQFPALKPLEKSFTADEVEAQLKALFIQVFKEKLGEGAFDANVLGVAHLGHFDLIRRFIHADGLALAQNTQQEYLTRFLYRAWKFGKGQGRGLHFLRLYLQLLVPNAWDVQQLWQEKSKTYPQDLQTGVQVQEKGLKADVFLTSRVAISLEFSKNTAGISAFLQNIEAIMPARLVPEFRGYVANISAKNHIRYATILREAVTIGPRLFDGGDWKGGKQHASWAIVENKNIVLSTKQGDL